MDEDVKRRALIAEALAAALGNVILGTGEPIELALPTGQVLPPRLSMVHVHIVRAVTDHLRGVARYYGGQAGAFGAVSTIYTQWMQVPAPEVVTTQLAAALAELRTEAGWCCHDDGVDGTGHFSRAFKLAAKAGDAYGIANAALHAGVTLVRSGHPNDALKFFQAGQIRLQGLAPGKPAPPPDDPRLPTLTARLSRQSATASALMGDREEATRCLAEANEGWEPRTAFERAGGNFVTAGIHLDLGQLDAAEHFAASAVRTYSESEGRYRRGHTQTELLLAEVHIRAGEPQGLTLAHHAIEQVKTLQSIAARRERLIPLATALDARPGTDARDLARTARQVAATRI
ncbi:MAG: hypothetical protein JO272_18505 [Pseudonocardiales bacterium]|nr:hypothetical protein [Pseudonocardiales bacterium]